MNFTFNQKNLNLHHQNVIYDFDIEISFDFQIRRHRLFEFLDKDVVIIKLQKKHVTKKQFITKQKQKFNF